MRAFLSLLPLWCRRKRQSRQVTQLKQQLKRTGAQRDRDLFRPLLKGLSQQAAQLRRAIANKKGSARLPWF
ncbi:hypothetical protein ACFOSS_11495 [Pseudaeromonas sharmana]|uniref:Uncharacterized protein n=1 Tax=Pseudaeromonas sharmana TaxID=328412 RepID=A0ABV8CQA5_9GAMM